ncbi:MAG: DUF4058 family protein [Planctomycetes bacterium]|nr:DUF4058 family protein [Planctomycetota bacterium]
MALKSPFPGMDPYLESHWRDVHASLVIYLRDAIQPRLPAGLKARVDERVFVECQGLASRSIYPDVRVVEGGRGRKRKAMATGQSGIAVAEPLVLHVQDEPMTETYIEILDVGTGGRVVTVIEILSPTNKSDGPGRNLYVRKQKEVLAAEANLVEIDLVRGGERVLSVDWTQIPPSHRTPYIVCVRRGHRPFEAEIYRAPLQERLPGISIPLREDDSDVPVDLQALVDRCYEDGDYGDLDYRAQPVPPFAPEDAAWADELLRAARRR